MEVKAVSDRLCDLGEGPFWDVNTQKLYFVDAFVGDVCRLDPATGSTDSVHFDGLVTFVIPYKISPSNVLISYKRSLRKLNFNTGDSEFLTELSEGHSEARFNDAKCDKRGRLWAGTLVENEEEKGHLYKLDPENKLTQVSDGITLSNGIAWSLDNRTMYFIDSVPRKIYAFDFNLENGTATNKRVLLDYNTKEEYADLGVPDGMTIDIEGKLWVACFGGACVLRIDPETTNILRKVDIPCKNVTSCCFGGPHFDTLYVTTAIKFQSDEAKAIYPKAGAVFAVTGLGVRGQPASYYVE